MSDEKNYWVITVSEDAYGPYESEADAHFFGSMNLEPGTWTITET